jgi:hypothetical protein
MTTSIAKHASLREYVGAFKLMNIWQQQPGSCWFREEELGLRPSSEDGRVYVIG